MEVKLYVHGAMQKMLLFFLNMMLFAMLSFMYTDFVFIFKHVYVQLC